MTSGKLPLLDKPSSPETRSAQDTILDLAKHHGVAYQPSPNDAWAHHVTRLAGDEVEFDTVEFTLLALERAGALSPAEGGALLVRYMRERKQ